MMMSIFSAIAGGFLDGTDSDLAELLGTSPDPPSTSSAALPLEHDTRASDDADERRADPVAGAVATRPQPRREAVLPALDAWYAAASSRRARATCRAGLVVARRAGELGGRFCPRTRTARSARDRPRARRDRSAWRRCCAPAAASSGALGAAPARAGAAQRDRADRARSSERGAPGLQPAGGSSSALCCGGGRHPPHAGA